MTITCNLYINGQWHDAEGRRTFTRRHPAHDEAASVAAAASLADGKRCVEAAACAFPLWRDTAPAEPTSLTARGGGTDAVAGGEIYRRHGGGDRRDRALGRI